MSVFTFTSLQRALPAAAGPRVMPRRAAAAQLPAFSGMLRVSGHADVLAAEPAACCPLEAAPSNGGTTTAMRHGVKKARLGRPADQRKALVRSLVTEVLRHGKVTTTKTRAMAIRKHVDKMIGLAKAGTLHARRQALAFVYDGELVASLFEAVPGRYGGRAGGYCRVLPEVQRRRGDGVELAVIELV